MIRALREYQLEGVKSLIPFHVGLLSTEQWANGETCRDLIEDKKWLKQFEQPKPEAPADEDEDEPKVERDYAVEVSGRRFDVKVIGAAPVGAARERRGAGQEGPEALVRAAAAAAAALPASSSRRSRARCSRSRSRRAPPSRRARSSA